jgi:flagellar protein FlgJ
MSITIGNNNILNAASALNTSNNTNKIEQKLSSNLKDSTDEELMDVCKSFEAYFVEQMFKEMKKTVPTTGEENQYITYFQDMLYQEYAEDTTENGGIGIAKMLYESMKRNV